MGSIGKHPHGTGKNISVTASYIHYIRPMDKVLIVDSDKRFLKELEERFLKAHQFELLCAGDGEKAIKILSEVPVSVFVTDINVSKVEALELLAFVSRKLPGIPCIVMSSYGKPWFYGSSNQNETLYHLEKPVTVSSLASAIMVALSIKDENSSGGISLNSFLPLVELEGKTCRLEVMNSGHRAYLYFERGSIIDAHLKDLKAEDVIKEILKWNNIRLKFGELPRRRAQKRLNLPIMELVSATWEKDRVLGDGKLEFHDADPETAFVWQTVEKLLSSLVKRFETVKGYKGLAILDKNFNRLAGDRIDKTPELQDFYKKLSSLFTEISPVFSGNGWDRCKMLSFHTAKGIIHILDACDLPVQPLFLICITESGGNWLFMKFELENFEKQLREKLKNANYREAG